MIQRPRAPGDPVREGDGLPDDRALVRVREERASGAAGRTGIHRRVQGRPGARAAGARRGECHHVHGAESRDHPGAHSRARGRRRVADPRVDG